MTRWFTLLSLIAIVIGVSPDLGQQVFRSRTDAVTVSVSVLQRGRAVSGLSARDFELRDNGVVQTVADLTPDQLPIDVTFVIDFSGSVVDAQLNDLRKAARQIDGALSGNDRCRVVSFALRIRQAAPMGPPPCDFELKRPPEEPWLGTAMVDASILTLIEDVRPDRRQLGIVLTDGLENASFFDWATVVDATGHSEVVWHTVLAPGTMSQAPRFRPLRSAVEATGGQVIVLRANDRVSDSFLAAIDQFRTSYVLRFVPTGVRREGWHELNLRTTNPRAAGARVFTRRGYFGG
jgi:hypothetical protein